jgi:hypothetical protein
VRQPDSLGVGLTIGLGELVALDVVLDRFDFIIDERPDTEPDFLEFGRKAEVDSHLHLLSRCLPFRAHGERQ